MSGTSGEALTLEGLREFVLRMRLGVPCGADFVQPPVVCDPLLHERAPRQMLVLDPRAYEDLLLDMLPRVPDAHVEPDVQNALDHAWAQGRMERAAGKGLIDV